MGNKHSILFIRYIVRVISPQRIGEQLDGAWSGARHQSIPIVWQTNGRENETEKIILLKEIEQMQQEFNQTEQKDVEEKQESEKIEAEVKEVEKSVKETEIVAKKAQEEAKKEQILVQKAQTESIVIRRRALGKK
mgnify:CR=1 FL=1